MIPVWQACTPTCGKEEIIKSELFYSLVVVYLFPPINAIDVKLLKGMAMSSKVKMYEVLRLKGIGDTKLSENLKGMPGFNPFFMPAIAI